MAGVPSRSPDEADVGARAGRWAHGADLAREWARLSREIRACRRCPLGSTRTHAVVYRGSLTPRLVFVGEAPGAAEDRVGEPFVGPSGRRLDAAIREVGVPEAGYGVLNLLKCRPQHNRFDPRAARTCRPFLDRQLELLRPEGIVTLGARALAALDPDAPAILRCEGRPRESHAPPIFPMLHPAAALRSRRWARLWDREVLALREWWTARPSKRL